jgi:hypothetical protein
MFMKLSVVSLFLSLNFVFFGIYYKKLAPRHVNLVTLLQIFQRKLINNDLADLLEGVRG